jgi:arylsulfatase A-like enzyme
MTQSSKPSLSWLQLFIQSILSIYAYLFMEWLFFATKPSFMDTMSFGDKLEIFLLAGFVLVELTIPLLVIFRILGLIPGPTQKWQVFQFIGAALPAFFYATTCLLMVDNFTNTLFKFGTVTSKGVFRGGYAILLIILFAVWYRQVIRIIRTSPISAPGEIEQSTKPRTFSWQRFQVWLGISLLALSLGFGLVRISEKIRPAVEAAGRIKRQPNIILLGGEGVVAKHMSLYGYDRDTTPRLRQLAETGLLAENNFTNASHTTGSVFSILSGKYPAQTRVLYSPNILQGEDAYQHLPGILQRSGYLSYQITFPYYIDAYDVNLQEGFDEVNGRTIDQGEIFLQARRFHLEEVGYFLPRLYERITSRLLHIFYIRSMPDPYSYVIQAVNPDQQPQLNDQERIRQLTHLLLSDQPVFVHVHMMGTHGGEFYPRRRVFSVGENQTTEWMPDFYDDAILDFDAYIGELLTSLQNNDLLDQTVIVIYSDHADQWRSDDKIPLLFHFPNGEYTSRIKNNTQNLDIAPTLLDYLGLEKPGWMPGQSLLQGEPPLLRPMISARYVGEVCEGWWCTLDTRLVRPPFYQFGSIQLVVCQGMYTLNLNTQILAEAKVDGHTAPCAADQIPTDAKAREIIKEHLQTYGFDVASLK